MAGHRGYHIYAPEAVAPGQARPSFGHTPRRKIDSFTRDPLKDHMFKHVAWATAEIQYVPSHPNAGPPNVANDGPAYHFAEIVGAICGVVCQKIPKPLYLIVVPEQLVFNIRYRHSE
jgi:hypothetical protein